MALPASVILSSVSTTLLDPGFDNWTYSELLGYLDEAQSGTCFVKPDAYVLEGAQPLIAGVIQHVPDDGIALIDITLNEVSGRVVTEADRGLLAEANRFWPAATQQVDVENYAADPRNPKRFFVYPPNNGSGSVDMVYGAVPPRLQDQSGDPMIGLSDSYQHALACFVLSKAYSKNTKRYDPVKAKGFMDEWAQSLGMKTTAQIAVAPKVNSSPGVT